MRISSILLSIILLIVTGCAELVYTPQRSTDEHLASYQLTPPNSPAEFVTCSHYNCQGRTQVALNEEEWHRVEKLFSPETESAAQERRQIAAAIGLLERLVGLKNNTFADQACNNFKNPRQSFQLDCIAESLNSTIYLQLLEKEQLLRWHKSSHPTDRGFFDLNLPHATAVISQIDTQQHFAVDSWFFANGTAPVIVPLPSWRNGYWPEGACGDGQVTPLKRPQAEER